MSTTTTRVNRYAGPCVNCTGHVQAGEGTIEKISGGRWVVRHVECPTAVPAPTGRHAHRYDDDRAALAHRVGYVPRHAGTRNDSRVNAPSTTGAMTFNEFREANEFFDGEYSHDEEMAAYEAHLARSASAVTPDAPDAAEGYYTRGGESFRVVLNKAKTHTYAKRLVAYGDRLSWDYAPGIGRDLAAEGLIPMTATEAGRLGLLHGRCINCLRPLGGATLSAQVSAVIGYGETCAGNQGWDYPTGAAAQRAFLAAH